MATNPKIATTENLELFKELLEKDYIKNLSVSGTTITYTKGDGTIGTITTQDTDTWRGIQNVLTSDSTSDSLSAAQGKVLKELVDSKSDKATTLAGYGINDAYTKTEIDNKVNVRFSNTLPENAPDGTIIINPDEDTEIFNIDDINIDVDSALSLTSINPVQNKVVTKELEKIPCRLTVKCVGFDGKITESNIPSAVYDILDGPIDTPCFYRTLAPTTVKTVYKNHTYRLILGNYDSNTPLGHYYDPIVKGIELSNPDTLVCGTRYNVTEKAFTVTQDTEITIMFQKKREPITLTINLKDKNGNFVSDDVIVTDSFDNKAKTVGTYGKTPGQFTVQVTKGYEYTITPSLKGYNKKENNSPADPDKTAITQTSTEDTVIDIVYNKIYPSDFETDWASFHAQIAANPGTEVLPIGTELNTVYKDTVHNKTVSLKWNIVNWRYGEKEDGSQVWGCDLFQKIPIPDNTYVYGSSYTIWGESTIRNTLSGLLEQYQNNDFKNNLQAVKVITSKEYEGPAEYSYDKMWIPSATELYINTSYDYDSECFTKINEGNDNEYYWNNIVGLGSKIIVRVSQGYEQYLKPQFDNESDNSYDNQYFLRSIQFRKFSIPTESPKPDIPEETIPLNADDQPIEGETSKLTESGETYSYERLDYIYTITSEGSIRDVSSTSSRRIRPMCFFA